MVSSCLTSSIHKTNFKYDVFLSFRGEDTRTNFVDHLYHALEKESIETYKDDKKLEQGKTISKELFEAIEDSRFHVVVFSKNYASSSWCLDELVKIMECQKTMIEHTVFPIFYHVEPTQVRKQSGEFGKAFAKHEKTEDVEKWREALKEAANLSGWELKGHEVEFIKMVVNKISLKLPSVSADENLIGMRTRIISVLSSLNASPDEFCMIGITGMGGIGKTTLARAVFDQICNEFEGSSFVENVRESSNSFLLGLKSLQQQVLRDVLNDQRITVTGVLDGKMKMKKNMAGRKVLVVLDDVDRIEQLQALAGGPNWFKPGSKIIITTRDKQVLVAHKYVNSIQEVNLLTDEEAICLLSRCAFGTESPSPGYEKLSRQVVGYAAGLPLTITILGSSLFDEEKDVWIDALEKLKKIPLNEIQQKLELSYIDLEEDHKEIFLDVACMLKGWYKDEAIRVLESRGFHAISGLSVLQKKHLITISRDGRLDMHDHIQEMGRCIVRHSKVDEPRKHTRWWIQEEIEDILATNSGSEAKATECILLYSSSDINLEAIMKGLGKMKKLRFLLVSSDGFNWDRDLNGISQYLPNSLQYLCWWRYPFRSLPKTFQASNLVVLKMCGGRIEQLWEGGEIKVLDKLRFLQLTHSMLKTFDFRLTPHLESLDLEHCCFLVEVHMPFGCQKLKFLNLGFSRLRTLHLRLTTNLETLILEECIYLEEFHMFDECPRLRSLDLRLPKLRTIELGMTPNLETLKVNCKMLGELRTHDELDDLLKHLVLGGFRKLKFLSLIDSKSRTLELTLNLKKLMLENCDLEELHIPYAHVNLEFLCIKRCSKLKTLDLRQTPNLESLHLEECSSLVKIHAPIGGLKKIIHLLNSHGLLRSLDFDISDRAELNLCAESVYRCPLHPNNKVPKFQFGGFYREDLPSSFGNIENLISAGLSICVCKDLQSFFGNICGFQHLRNLTLKGPIPEVPKDLDRLQCLEELTLESTKIKHLPDSICMLKHLKNLGLYICMLLEKLPEDLGRLECLEILILSECVVLGDIPHNICKMKRLKYFGLSYCKKVDKLPEELGHLECLEELNVEGTRINHLPQSILSMKKGLRIVGSRELLESCDLMSKIQTIEDETFCYI